MRSFSIQRVWGMILRQWYEMRRSPDRIVDSFFWPSLDVAVWRLLTFFVERSSTLNVMSAILGAVIFWAFTYSIQRDITMTTIQDLWDRNLYNVIASPLRPIELLCAGIVYGLLRMVVLFSLLTGLARALYHFSFLVFLPFMAWGMLTVVLFGIAFGIVTSGVIYRYGSNVQILCWSGLALLMPILGIMYPVTLLPASVQHLSWVFPPTYVFAFVRGFIAEGIVPGWSAWMWPTALNIVYLALSTMYFRYAFRHAKRRGWFIQMD